MKKITLNDIEWKPTKNYWEGRSQSVTNIVIHHWSSPDVESTVGGVVSWFKNPSSQVSAHFVVSGDRVVQMVNMADTAWHAGWANPFTVGIELDPDMPGNTYETAGALVKFIRGYYGNTPLKRHRDYMNTRCPGNISLSKIERYASGRNKPSKGGKMKTNLTSKQWRSFISEVYYGFTGDRPTEKEVDFHLNKSNPLSFVNGFKGNYLWKKLNRKLKDKDLALDKAKRELQDAKNTLQKVRQKLKEAQQETDLGKLRKRCERLSNELAKAQDNLEEARRKVEKMQAIKPNRLVEAVKRIVQWIKSLF